MNGPKFHIAFCGLLLMMPALASAGPIATYLDGIGVTAPPTANDPASWVPDPGYGGAYLIEDAVGSGGYLGPGYGGQPYDLEALYVERVGDRYLITGISGAPQVGAPGDPPPLSDPSAREYGIGDFFVGVMNGSSLDPLFAIEMDGYTYGIDGNGYTVSQDPANPRGAIVTDMGTRNGLPDWGGVSDPVQIDGASGTVVGYATMNYEYLNPLHTGFQASIDAVLFETLLGGADTFIVHWSEACGNDFLRLEATLTRVPEPGALVLWAGGLGLLLLQQAAMRRRRSAI